MKIYLASSFANKELVQELANELEQEGHKITTEWWHTDFKKTIFKPDAEWYADEKILAISQRNFNGIREADALILVANQTPVKYNGANIELGFALALNKQCFSIGYLERSAMYVPVIQCKTKTELLSRLKKLSPLHD